MASKHLGADFTLISVSLIVSLSRPFSFSLFFCLSPVLFFHTALTLVSSGYLNMEFPILSDLTQPIRALTSRLYFTKISTSSLSCPVCHRHFNSHVSSCESRASLPETHICQRETCGYLCYAATYCGQTDPASPGVSCFILFQPSGLSVSQHALG